MSAIPTKIVFSPPSEAAVAMHEAGHAVVALVYELPPAFMEIIDTPSPHGRNRIPVVQDPKQRRLLAVGGYTVELALFQAGRLLDAAGAPLTERAFIQQAIGSNASMDKVAFFGANHEQPDGTWPQAMDREFMGLGKQLSDMLPLDRVSALAEELLTSRKVDADRIIEIWNSFIPEAPHEV